MPSKSFKQIKEEKEARNWVSKMVHRIGTGTQSPRTVNSVLREATELFPVQAVTVREHIEWCIEDGMARLDNDTIKKKSVNKK